MVDTIVGLHPMWVNLGDLITNINPTAVFNVDTLKIPKVVEKQKDKTPMNKQKFSDRYKYRPLSKYVGLFGKTPIVAPSTFVGVEVELEYCTDKSKIPSTWVKIVDSSLKIEGIEYVTRPIQVKYLEVELIRLFKGIPHSKPTTRCSIHVHLNVRDFTLEELEKFLILYLIFERSLYRVSGDRWHNNFCVPLYNYPISVKEMLHSLSKGEFYNSWFKYYGLNLSPIFGGESSKIGTIEFRHLIGTKDINHILLWVNLITSLKIAAKRMNIVQLKQRIIDMNNTSDYNTLVEEVFRSHSTVIKEQPTFKDDVEMCITQLKYCMPIKNTVISVEIPIINQGGR